MSSYLSDVPKNLNMSDRRRPLYGHDTARQTHPHSAEQKALRGCQRSLSCSYSSLSPTLSVPP